MINGQALKQQKILILAAIPKDLRLDEEIREIEDAINRAIRRDLFDVEKKLLFVPKIFAMRSQKRNPKLCISVDMV